MRLDLESKILLLSNPKTASTSIRNVLDNNHSYICWENNIYLNNLKEEGLCSEYYDKEHTNATTMTSVLFNVYNLNNVELFEGNATKIYNWLTDILYIDPPWGGINYRNSNNIDLFLGDYRLDEYLDFILKQEWKPKYVVLKLPKNYNFNRLNNFNGKKYDILNKSKDIRFNIFIIN